MSYMKNFASFFVSIGLIFSSSAVFAENDPSSKYRVLSTENSSLSIITIDSFVDQAKASINAGKLDDAVEKL